MKLSIDTLRELWGNGKRLTIGKRDYRVGRMSYGDYFLEPGQERGETKPFNHGTKWAKRIDEYWYEI